MEDHFFRIKQLYDNLKGDSTGLFSEILAVSQETGLDKALALLEKCVIEKRSAWLEANLLERDKVDDPLMAGYRWFYENYLHVSLPEDGEIIEHNDKQIIMRWWNPCPTLDACVKLGLDTRQVCQKAYHRPVTEFLKTIHPNLRFERNYRCIRPYTPYCEEIIKLVNK